MQSFDFKKFLPHLLLILGFIVLAALYSYPQLDGMELKQGDNVSWKAMSKEARDWHEKTGENTLWSNSMFGGMPTFTYYVPEGNNYIYPIQQGIMGVLGKPTGFLFLAMLGFYILMSVMGVNRWLAAAGAIAYAFSTYNVTLIEAGHETKMWALAYFPIVLGGLMLLYKGKYWVGLPVLGISMSLLMTTAHYQIMYYAIIVIIGMVITYFIIALREGQLKTFLVASALALVGASVGIGTGMQGFLSTYEYNKTTMRGGESELTLNHDQNKKSGGLDKDYAFDWSNELGESFTVLVPMLYGSSSSEGYDVKPETYDLLTGMGIQGNNLLAIGRYLPTYWGTQPFTGGPFYFGAIICFLFVLGVIVIRSPHKWWMIAVCVLAFIMSWGEHFPSVNYFLFDTLPGLNKFRIPNMILVLPQLLFPVLGIWALNDILESKWSKEEVWKHVKLAGIITGGLCLLIGIAGSALFSFQAPIDGSALKQLTNFFQNEEAAKRAINAIREDRISMAMSSAFTSAFFIALIVAVLWAYAKGHIKAQYVAFAVIILVSIDLIRVDTKYLNEENFVYEEEYNYEFEPRPVDQQILQDPDPYYRVLDLSKNTYNDAIQSYHHKTIGGYSPAKMEAYQDMIDIHMSSSFNAEVLNMLNTKYIISPQGQNGQPVAIPNPDANGNAWFVSKIKWAETADEEMLSLNARSLGDTTQVPNAFDASEEAVLRTSYKDELSGFNYGKDSAAYVKLDQYGLNNISYVSKNSKDGLAVFSDMYYPYGWTAYIDGNETPILKANYLLRALKVPAGEHKIEFKFRPKSFYTGDNIAMVSSILLILMAVGSIGMAYKKGKDA